MIENPNGVQRTLQLDRNENFARSNLHAKAAYFTVIDQPLENSHSLSNSNILNQSSINELHKEKTSYNLQYHQPYLTSQASAPVANKMNRQLQTGMSLPPFKRILRKCHSGQQTTVTIPPTNFASFTEISEEPCQSTLSFSDVRHQVIPSRDSFTFNKKSDQLCQKDPPDHPTECQAISMEEEDVPLFRKNLRKALDMEFIAAATKRDRNLQPLINMIRQQKWDQIKACYGPYFYNVRDRLSVRNNVLLYDDRVAIPKQLRQIILDSIHLTHPGQGGMLEAAKHIWYPYLHRDIVTSAQSCKECRAKGKNLRVISGKKHFTSLDAVVEPNEEIQLDFAGPLPDENNKDVYILVGVDRFPRFPSSSK